MKPPAPAVAWLVAIAAAAAATAVARLLDPHMSVAGLSMVYLVAVAGTALTLPRAAGIGSALLCVTALNFFFVPPRYSLQVDGAEYWWMLAVLLLLSLALNAIIARLKERHARAELASTRNAQLHALGEEIAGAQGHEAMAQAAAAWLRHTLGRPCAVFLAVDGEAGAPVLHAGGGDPATAFQPSAAQWAIEHARPLGRGCADWPDLPLWCAPFAGREAGGALQVLLAPGDKPAADELRHWLALARQAGLSIERERAASLARSAQASATSEAARNTLLASLSHDLRTPLAGILGSASALRTQDGTLGAQQRDRLLANLEDEARDMTQMADNILQMARLSQPQAEVKVQWESAEEVLGAAVARLRRRWPHARLELRVTPHLPPLRAEAGLLAQLVANLVDNAMRHGGEHPHVTVRAGRSREGIFIAVRDHGSGFPPGDPARLFERFGQRHSDGAAGLGLALCQLIARAHGGRIEAHRCDPGAEFRVDLPVAERERVQ